MILSFNKQKKHYWTDKDQLALAIYQTVYESPNAIFCHVFGFRLIAWSHTTNCFYRETKIKRFLKKLPVFAIFISFDAIIVNFHVKQFFFNCNYKRLFPLFKGYLFSIEFSNILINRFGKYVTLILYSSVHRIKVQIFFM